MNTLRNGSEHDSDRELSRGRLEGRERVVSLAKADPNINYAPNPLSQSQG